MPLLLLPLLLLLLLLLLLVEEALGGGRALTRIRPTRFPSAMAEARGFSSRASPAALPFASLATQVSTLPQTSGLRTKMPASLGPSVASCATSGSVRKPRKMAWSMGRGAACPAPASAAPAAATGPAAWAGSAMQALSRRSTRMAARGSRE